MIGFHSMNTFLSTNLDRRSGVDPLVVSCSSHCSSGLSWSLCDKIMSGQFATCAAKSNRKEEEKELRRKERGWTSHQPFQAKQSPPCTSTAISFSNKERPQMAISKAAATQKRPGTEVIQKDACVGYLCCPWVDERWLKAALAGHQTSGLPCVPNPLKEP